MLELRRLVVSWWHFRGFSGSGYVEQQMVDPILRRNNGLIQGQWLVMNIVCSSEKNFDDIVLLSIVRGQRFWVPQANAIT